MERRTVQKFKDLEFWKESFRWSVDSYKMLKEYKDSGLRDQLQRASVLIPSNITEGFESNTKRDFIKFLFRMPDSGILYSINF